MVTKIIIRSILEASADVIWERLGQVETLRTIAKPYAFFKPLSDMTAWQAGEEYDLSFRLFGCIPMGRHHICVVKWDKSAWSILTQESDKLATTWNHEIVLKPIDEDKTEYKDTVELDAGFLTPVARLWALAFYRHRQRKWKTLLK